MKKTSQLPDKIAAFIEEHHVLTLATTRDSKPWTAHCFYVFDSERSCFYIASDTTTRHGQEALENSDIAGAIVLETKTVGKIRGLQFSGSMKIPTGTEAKHAKKMYISRFPFAVLTKTQMWAIHMSYAKYTDNRLGFGTKLIWE